MSQFLKLQNKTKNRKRVAEFLKEHDDNWSGVMDLGEEGDGNGEPGSKELRNGTWNSAMMQIFMHLSQFHTQPPNQIKEVEEEG